MWKSSLTADEAAAVDALVARAAATDGTSALNEDARLARDDGSYRHLLHSEDGRLVGYLTHSTDYGTAQLVVDPAHRRHGIGRRLVEQLSEFATPQLWAFGDGAAAQALARSLHLVPGRGLLIMEKDLGTDESPAGRGSVPDPHSARHPRESRSPATRPEEGSGSPARSGATAGAPGMAAGGDGVTLRPFVPSDAARLLDVNAAAFAHHPEQGRLDLAGLQARMAEPWFDPAGLIEAFEGDTMLGFHWTKRHDATTGEVYVLAVHPRAQGRGLGRRLLTAGLQQLRASGCTRVILYVDRADTVAVGLYESGGFTVAHRDVLYVPAAEQERA